MKKKILIGAAATAMLCCSVAVSGCGIFGDSNNHKHSLNHHAGQAATCTEDGWEAYDTCDYCDYSTYTVIPANGHSYDGYICHCGDVDPDAPETAAGLQFNNESTVNYTVKRTAPEDIGKLVKIPSTFNGRPVTAIADFGFAGCSELVCIIIPSSVKKIGSNAFKTCPALVSVIFEDASGWIAGGTYLSSGDLSNTETAAAFLTSTHLEKEWWKN